MAGLVALLAFAACGGSTSSQGSGGATGGKATGGDAAGGKATGGASTGGKATGGDAAGGKATGGAGTGGKATGGDAAGGKATGGAGTGGKATGGDAAGGKATGGAATGGSDNACENASDCAWGEINHEILTKADCVCLFGCPYLPQSRTTVERRRAQYTALCTPGQNGQGMPCPIDDCIEMPSLSCVNGACARP
ncbi:MAG TPA: hypothetical protein VG937_09675 [Polyangiaceae bacterium]|nr:hypothetical protein [Polyangiaceae bacterium]